MRKTGGGPSTLTEENVFQFSQKQIVGLTNKFDSDFVKEDEEQALVEYGFEGIEIEEGSLQHSFSASSAVKEDTPKRSSSTPLQKYANKKMKMTKIKDDLFELKAEGIKLDNEYKQHLIDKVKLEKIKLQMEIDKMQSDSMNQTLE